MLLTFLAISLYCGMAFALRFDEKNPVVGVVPLYLEESLASNAQNAPITIKSECCALQHAEGSSQSTQQRAIKTRVDRIISSALFVPVIVVRKREKCSRHAYLVAASAFCCRRVRCCAHEGWMGVINMREMHAAAHRRKLMALICMPRTGAQVEGHRHFCDDFCHFSAWPTRGMILGAIDYANLVLWPPENSCPGSSRPQLRIQSMCALLIACHWRLENNKHCNFWLSESISHFIFPRGSCLWAAMSMYACCAIFFQPI